MSPDHVHISLEHTLVYQSTYMCHLEHVGVSPELIGWQLVKMHVLYPPSTTTMVQAGATSQARAVVLFLSPAVGPDIWGPHCTVTRPVSWRCPRLTDPHCALTELGVVRPSIGCPEGQRERQDEHQWCLEPSLKRGCAQAGHSTLCLHLT